MFGRTTRRLRTALAAAQDRVTAQQRLVQAAHDERVRLQRRRDSERDRLIEDLVTDYYQADALAHLAGPGREFQTGVTDGIVQALGHVTGVDTIRLRFRLETGQPVTGTGWAAVNTAPVGADPVVVLRHDGIEEPVEQRLRTLREQALHRRGHPLARTYPTLVVPATV